MAGLWEPVGGVFWSAPPDESWASLPTFIVLLVAAGAVAAVAVRIGRKRKQPGWHLRQHMVEIGGAFTLIYLAGITELTWGRLGTLGAMPLNEVGDFLAGAFGPVAFLWLVLGFLQQGEELRMQATELRNSVEQQTSMAATAKQQMDMQIQERNLALQAMFTIEVTSAISDRKVGWARNAIRTKNEGKKALGATLYFDPPIPEVRPLLLGDFAEGEARGGHYEFSLIEGGQTGLCHIIYVDASGARRTDSLRYAMQDDQIEFWRVFDRV